MSVEIRKNPLVAVACGGTGGHFYPGLAVARRLCDFGCDILLIVSEKEIDQVVSASAQDMEIVKIPAVGLDKGYFSFGKNFVKSILQVRKIISEKNVRAVFGTGGFSSAPAIVATWRKNCRAFIHEANSYPGKANRVAARFVHTAFVYFRQAAKELKAPRIEYLGMPVREVFAPVDHDGVCGARMCLGLNIKDPVLLVTGGSQGASAINNLVRKNLPKICKRVPNLQVIHLTGKGDFLEMKKFYESFPIKSVVREYLTEMETAMAAATAVVGRAGASSSAEIAAMKIPALLIPYPHATANHQFYNALAFKKTGAAMLLQQDSRDEKNFSNLVCKLLMDSKLQSKMKAALGKWSAKKSDLEIARRIIKIAMPDANLDTDWDPSPVL